MVRKRVLGALLFLVGGVGAYLSMKPQAPASVSDGGSRGPASVPVADDTANEAQQAEVHGAEFETTLVATNPQAAYSGVVVNRAVQVDIPALRRVTEFAADASACKRPQAERDADTSLAYRCMRARMNGTRAKLFNYARAQAKKNPRYRGLANLESLAAERCKSSQGFSDDEMTRIEELVEGGIPNEPQRPELGVAIYRKVKGKNGKVAMKPYMYWGERDFFALTLTAMGEARVITYNRTQIDEPMVNAHMMVVMKCMKNNMSSGKFNRDMFGLGTHGTLYQPWFANNDVTPCMIAGLDGKRGGTLDLDRAVFAYTNFINPHTKFRGVTNQMFYFARAEKKKGGGYTSGKPFTQGNIGKTPVSPIVEFPPKKGKKRVVVDVNTYNGEAKHFYWNNLEVKPVNSNF